MLSFTALALCAVIVYNVMYNQPRHRRQMSEMVRKQFYIHERQQEQLKRLSQARRVSEAEIIRQAIEREAAAVASGPAPPDRAVWEQIKRFVEMRKALGPGCEPYQWNRQHAYEERESFDNQPQVE
jgi:hypothetical protein